MINSNNIIILLICLTIFTSLLRKKFNFYILLTNIGLFVATFLSLSIMNKIFTTNDYNKLQLTLYITSISFISMSFISMINIEQLLFYLMQKYRILIPLLYPILIANNAVIKFIHEYKTINYIHKMRYNNQLFSLRIINNLLISAIRYAINMGIVLELKNLNNQKTFVNDIEKLKTYDYVIICMIILLISIYFKYSKTGFC